MKLRVPRRTKKAFLKRWYNRTFKEQKRVDRMYYWERRNKVCVWSWGGFVIEKI